MSFCIFNQQRLWTDGTRNTATLPMLQRYGLLLNQTVIMKTLLLFLTIFYSITVFGQAKQGIGPYNFLPKGYVIFSKINGDLNNDSTNDCVLIIKGTDKSKIVANRFGKKVDRNRRGIVILFRKKGHYELAEKNYNCFSSENEDGGVYFPPELYIEIKNEKLYINYGDGRYGYWKYTFRYQNLHFELIGYDESSDSGPIVNRVVSINFLTKRKLVMVNVNRNPKQESGQETFKKNRTSIKIKRLIKLSEIKDFDNLDMTLY